MGRAAGLAPGIGPATRAAFEVFLIGLSVQCHPGGSSASSTDRSAAIALIQHAVDLGVTLVDTGEAYGPFLSEGILVEALQGIRDTVVLCTKFGFDIRSDDGRATQWTEPPAGTQLAGHTPNHANFLRILRRRPDLNRGWRFCRFNEVVNRVVSCWSLVCPAPRFTSC